MSSQGPAINTATPATFSITKANGVYTAVLIDAGTEFAIQDFVTVTGDQLGGSTTANDCLVTVKSTTTNNAIATATSSGSAKTTYSITLPVETEATFSLSKSGSSYSVTLITPGANFRVNDAITIAGSLLGGSDSTNNALVTVTGVNGGGAITSLSVSGTAVTSYKVSLTTTVWSGNPQPTAGPSNIIAAPRVTISGTSYSVSFDSGYPLGTDDGRGYGTGPTHAGGPFNFKIPGTYLGGTSPANDLTFTYTNAGSGVGELQGLTNVSGTAVSSYSPFPLPAGDPAGIDVDVSTGSYSITVTSGGTRYVANQSYTVDGSLLGGVSSTNDLSFQVNTVNGGGALLTVKNITGTAVNSYTTFVFPNSNYKFRQSQIRDAGDWIIQKRQAREYQTYKTSSVMNKSTEDPWITFGTGFRLSFLNGEYKLRVANGNGFNTSA